ncbi:hypothetical protein SAMN05877809_10114 [Rhodobacter sp. JA431]|nr:hypothetical protein SAMN05877809_10114 [Rhodobacter sp. JA431]
MRLLPECRHGGAVPAVPIYGRAKLAVSRVRKEACYGEEDRRPCGFLAADR